jgi:heat shock protein HslJ
MKNFLVALFFLALWTACRAPAASLPAGQNFQLRELDGQAVPDLVQATIRFDTIDKRVSGNTSCNAYSGPYEQGGSDLSFGPLITTKKFCTETASWEQRFLAMMEKVDGFILADRQLRLRSGSRTVAVFE